MAHILIIEDDEVSRAILRAQLEKRGYLVDEAASAESALGLLGCVHSYDIILIDYQLPGMDGLDFLRTQTQKTCCERRCSTPVVMLTGMESVNLAVAFMQLGGADFVTKPIRNYDILDITLRRVLEVTRSRCELAEAEAAQRAAEEANQLILDFVDKMHHELVTPGQFVANGVRYVRAALEQCDKPKAEKWLNTIERSNRRLLRMTTDILDCSRIRHGKLTLRPADMVVETVIETAFAEARERCGEKHITLTSEVEDLVIHADADRLGQILANLLGNAIRYTPEHGTIHLRAYRVEGGVTFSVTDTGPGIRAELQPYIFDEFQQDAEARQTSGALGLGLAICRGLVELHGGTITFSEHQPSGAIFTFHIPDPSYERNTP